MNIYQDKIMILVVDMYFKYYKSVAEFFHEHRTNSI